VEPRSGAGGVVTLLLFVVAVAALGEVVAGRDAAAARRAYLTALFRARGERSLVGVLTAAGGFKTLGDREVVEHALRMAAALDSDAR